MAELHGWAIGVAAVAAFVISSVWYAVFGARTAELRPAADTGDATATPPPRKMVLELLRSLIVASVLAWLASRIGVVDGPGAVQLGAVAWIGFPVVLLAGSVLWEGVPAKLAVIHAGDWLVKLLAIALIIALWQ